MGDLIRLADGRKQVLARKAFKTWRRRFGEDFDENTCAQDLSDKTLGQLIKGEEATEGAIQELVVTVRKGGQGQTTFDTLNSSAKIALIDVMLFIIDQLRFEAMRRLGWIDAYATQDVALVDLVEKYQDRFAANRHRTPPLSKNHPRYMEYLNTFEEDRAIFIRRMIPEAIKEFCARC